MIEIVRYEGESDLHPLLLKTTMKHGGMRYAVGLTKSMNVMWMELRPGDPISVHMTADGTITHAAAVMLEDWETRETFSEIDGYRAIDIWLGRGPFPWEGWKETKRDRREDEKAEEPDGSVEDAEHGAGETRSENVVRNEDDQGSRGGSRRDGPLLPRIAPPTRLERIAAAPEEKRRLLKAAQHAENLEASCSIARAGLDLLESGLRKAMVETDVLGYRQETARLIAAVHNLRTITDRAMRDIADVHRSIQNFLFKNLGESEVKAYGKVQTILRVGVAKALLDSILSEIETIRANVHVASSIRELGLGNVERQEAEKVADRFKEAAETTKKVIADLWGQAYTRLTGIDLRTRTTSPWE